MLVVFVFNNLFYVLYDGLETETNTFKKVPAFKLSALEINPLVSTFLEMDQLKYTHVIYLGTLSEFQELPSDNVHNPPYVWIL